MGVPNQCRPAAACRVADLRRDMYLQLMARRELPLRDRRFVAPLAVVNAAVLVGAVLTTSVGFSGSASRSAAGPAREHVAAGSPLTSAPPDDSLSVPPTTAAVPLPTTTSVPRPGSSARPSTQSPAKPVSSAPPTTSSPSAHGAEPATTQPRHANPYGGAQGQWSCDGRTCTGMTPHGTDSWTCTGSSGRVNCSGASIGNWSCGSTYQTWRTISCSAPTGDAFGGWQCNQAPGAGPDADLACYSNKPPALQWKWKRYSDPNTGADRWDGWGDTGFGSGTWSCVGGGQCTGTVGATEIVSPEAIPIMLSDFSP
jgi:hypothetical protein